MKKYRVYLRGGQSFVVEAKDCVIECYKDTVEVKSWQFTEPNSKFLFIVPGAILAVVAE